MVDHRCTQQPFHLRIKTFSIVSWTAKPTVTSKAAQWCRWCKSNSSSLIPKLLIQPILTFLQSGWIFRIWRNAGTMFESLWVRIVRKRRRYKALLTNDCLTFFNVARQVIVGFLALRSEQLLYRHCSWLGLLSSSQGDLWSAIEYGLLLKASPLGSMASCLVSLIVSSARRLSHPKHFCLHFIYARASSQLASCFFCIRVTVFSISGFRTLEGSLVIFDLYELGCHGKSPCKAWLLINNFIITTWRRLHLDES